jgi:prepilin-type N-terminal cleavage/methylation domain-containing protein
MKVQSKLSFTGRRRSSSGFTLVELMVVIGMVAVLALIVTVMARNSRQKAREVSSIGPLRNIAQINAEFAAENNGQINTLKWDTDPIEGKNKQGGNAFVSGTFWGRSAPHLFPDVTVTNQAQLKTQLKLRLDNYFGTQDASKMSGTWLQGVRIYHDGSGLPIPFGFNNNLYKFNDWIRMSQVSDTAQIIYVTYGFGMINETHGQTATPRPRDGSRPTNNIYYLDSGKAMAAFLDGRVEMLSVPISSRHFK